MTDRYHSLTVVLEKDLRDDDCQPVMAAIGMIRGVASVQGVVSNMESNMAKVRARRELGHKLLAICFPPTT